MKNRWKPTSIVAVAVVSMAMAVPAAASAAWGSIALNPQTGQAGVSFNEQTKADASDAAVKDCPGKCRPALFVRNKCGAIAHNDARYVAGFGNSKHEAISKAKAKARKGPGRTKLTAYVCSG
jgi:uncharacterized protein DUF4189